MKKQNMNTETSTDCMNMCADQQNCLIWQFQQSTLQCQLSVFNGKPSLVYCIWYQKMM